MTHTNALGLAIIAQMLVFIMLWSTVYKKGDASYMLTCFILALPFSLGLYLLVI